MRRLWLSCLLVACGDTPTGDPDAASPVDDADLPPVSLRYPSGTVASPVTVGVADAMRAIAARGDGHDDVFIKVGASGTVSRNLLFCFAGAVQPQYRLELDGRDALMPAIDFFRGGDIAGATPFDRVTLAAEVGRTARWVVTGSPSPLVQELDAAMPRFAFVNYGTNDMGSGATYATSLGLFWSSMNEVLDILDERGVVTIITGLNPRGDTAEAERWAPTFDAVTRAFAEARQLPYVSLYVASSPLANQGLLSDGIHGNAYSNGGAQPCVFDAAGLAFNYNVRNLASMEMLAKVHDVVIDDAAAPDVSPVPLLAGAGTEASPFEIDALPFTHTFDTTNGERARASYPECGTQDESGPEVVYRLAMTSQRPVRVIALDREGVDVDVHVLVDGTCVERGDRVVDRTIGAGEMRIVVDTFAGSSGARPGSYTLVVQPCEDGDPSC
ncbi:MAG: SGNH/GDSL hydrolase family protein [Kofleriaceae bacterium]